MKKYTVRAHTDSFETDSLEEARSVMESMAMHYNYASIIDSESNELIDSLELYMPVSKPSTF